jgi:hypothetical protein
MNDKKVIENYRSIRDVERLEPQPLKPEDVTYIRKMIEDGFAKAKANPQPETRSLAEIIADIESDKSKSLARKLFEIRMAKMADRLAHKKPLSVSGGASQSDSVSDVLPLHEQIKFLREQKN